MTRLLRALVGFGALVAVVLLASGCASSQAPAPTPDPFVGLADRSDQAFRQGLEAYGQGQYRDALNAFEQARTFSPKADPRIDQMLDRTRAAMAPTPTPVPPTPTDVPATPTAVSVAMSQQKPDTDLGQRYFGSVSLVSVPGKDGDTPAATQFFFQDQVGLHIDGLKQHLRLPFTLRVFDAATSHLVADVTSDDASAATPASTPTNAPIDAPALAALGMPSATATSAATPTTDFKVVHFFDSFVWYHSGGEQPGRYHLELYANGVLTNTFDYSVGTEPVLTLAPTPAPTSQPTVEPTAAPVVEDLPPPPIPTPVPPPPAPRPAAPAAQPAAPAAPATPTLVPSPTPIPTPATAYTTQVGGVPAGIDSDSYNGRSYLVDASGVIWVSDSVTGAQRPTLGTPWYAAQGQGPVDLTLDQTTGYLYVPATRCQPGYGNTEAPKNPNCVIAIDGRRGGAVLKSIPLKGAPVQVRVDSDLGLLFVSMPTLQQVQELDIRSSNEVRSFQDALNPPSPITSLALDPYRDALYIAHLDGEVTVFDEQSGRFLARPAITGAGLSSVATARGLVYGVNTVTHELAVLEPVSGFVNRFPLSQEPAAVAAAEDSGAVYVLSSRSDVILQVDPTDGSELGRVLVNARSAHLSLDVSANVQTLRPRIALQEGSDAVFASIPDQGSIAAVGTEQFPMLARDIPFVGAPQLPLASLMDSTSASSDANEEGI